MEFGELRDHCLSKPGATEGFPFGESALVFKVAGKMFALIDVESAPLRISLKCDPEEAERLRTRHSAVGPGYHLNKAHWNTVEVDGSVRPEVLRGWVDDSYALVVARLTRAERASIPPQGRDRQGQTKPVP
jgi:predicted DNA-binding protein (MmcQ/YjbR family)